MVAILSRPQCVNTNHQLLLKHSYTDLMVLLLIAIACHPAGWPTIVILILHQNDISIEVQIM